MAKTTRLLAFVAVAGALGVGAYHFLGQGDDDGASGTKRLANQVWIERIPQTERDMIGHLALIKHRRGKFGAAGKSSKWRHFVEIFEWRLEGNKLRLRFPQEQQKAQMNVRTWDCRNEAPEPFEICLELSAQGRKRVYYSRKDWVIDVDDVEGSMAELGEENPGFAGVFENVVSEAPLLEADFEATQDWPESDFL